MKQYFFVKSTYSFLLWLLMIMVIFTSCEDDSPSNPTNPGPDPKVLIFNQGVDQENNASIYEFNLRTEGIQAFVYDSVNTRKLGDGLYSATEQDGFLYLVLKGSGVIEVIDQFSYISNGAISGFNAPEYILPVSTTKAYVTDAGGDSLSILDLRFGRIIGGIKVPGPIEEIAEIDDILFVASPERAYLYVIDLQTEMLIDSVQVGYGNSYLEVDTNDKLWVFNISTDQQGNNASLHRVNPFSLELEQSFDFESKVTHSDLSMNPGKDTLYYLNNGVFRIAITDDEAPSDPLIRQTGSVSFYSIAIEPISRNIYVSDIGDGRSPGNMLRHNPDGSGKDVNAVGINPSGFLFVR